MAAIVNARDLLLQATSPRMVAVALPSTTTVDFDQVTGSHKPSNNADVAQIAIGAGVTVSAGGITLSGGGALKGGKTTYGSGTGIFFGWHTSAYKLDVGSSSNYFRWDGSSLDINGNIIGNSVITITGAASFDGSVSVGGSSYAGVFNSSLGSFGGLYAKATSGDALRGNATSGRGLFVDASTGIGAKGSSTGTGGTGVHGTASGSGGTGVRATSSEAATTALAVEGPMTMTVKTLVSNLNVEYHNSYKFSGLNNTGTGVATFDGTNLPGSSATNKWAILLDTTGATVGRIPVW